MDSLPRDWMSWLESKHGFPFGFCFSFEECKRRHDKMDSAEETDHWDSLDGLSMCWDVLYRKLVVPGPLLVGKMLKVTSRNWGAFPKPHGSTSKNVWKKPPRIFRLPNNSICWGEPVWVHGP